MYTIACSMPTARMRSRLHLLTVEALELFIVRNLAEDGGLMLFNDLLTSTSTSRPVLGNLADSLRGPHWRTMKKYAIR